VRPRFYDGRSDMAARRAVVGRAVREIPQKAKPRPHRAKARRVLLVTYKLHDATYKAKVEELLDRGDYVRLTDGTIAVFRDEAAEVVCNTLRALTGGKITVAAFPIARGSAWAAIGAREAALWLEKHLAERGSAGSEASALPSRRRVR